LYRKEITGEVKKLHYESIIIDSCSFFCEGYNDSLKASGITALNITVPDTSDLRGEAVVNIADYYSVIRKDPNLVLIETVDDILRAKKQNKVGIIVGFQEARPLAHYFLEDMVDVFQRLGLRICILAYNERNFFADGCVEEANSGLSKMGRELVKAMNDKGVVIDLSHTGERSSLEAIEISDKPCIFSHSNPRVRSKQKRNITDEQIKKVAAKGGVIGLTPYPPMNWDGGKIVPTIDDFLNNIDYVVKLVGIDHAGIGTDKEATLGAYPRNIILRELDSLPFSVGDYYNNFAGNAEAVNLEGFPALAFFPVITQGLIDHGYDRVAVQKILGQNFLRVFREVWK
jgi:membrane dipeptidase